MVTGIGGVFIKAQDPKKLAEWYQTNLAIGFNGGSYTVFKTENEDTATAFSFVKEKPVSSNPSEKQTAVNFRVKDLDALLTQLKANGVWVDENVASYDFGKFGWCMDPEGNKIELWEPK